MYLGEAGQCLVQNVDFEIPYLRRNAAKLAGQLADGERKQGEYTRAAAACAAKYKEVGERRGGGRGHGGKGEAARGCRQRPCDALHCRTL